jgi:hypothetical protein
MRRWFISSFCVAGAFVGTALHAQVAADWRELNTNARAAVEKNDNAAAWRTLDKLVPAMNGYSRLLPRLAMTAALDGQPAACLRALDRYSRMGLYTPDVPEQKGWSPEERAEYSRIRARLNQNAQPVGTATVAFTLADRDLVPEDIAYDSKTKTFLISSTRERKVVAVRPDGSITDFIKTGQDGLWAAMGLAVDEKRRALWVSSGATPETTGYPLADAGHTAVFEYDLDTRALRRRYDLPVLKTPQLLGDIAVMPSGDVLAGDAYGMLYRVRPGSPTPEPMADRRSFVSVQEPAALPDGNHALVIDYVLGIGKIDLKTKALTWLRHPDDVALNGIDGIVVRGTRAIAVQNGTNPNRIIAIDFDEGFNDIKAVTVMEQKTPHLTEPTHGVIVGDAYYFIANSESDKLEAGGAVKKTEVLLSPVIQKLPLTVAK